MLCTYHHEYMIEVKLQRKETSVAEPLQHDISSDFQLEFSSSKATNTLILQKSIQGTPKKQEFLTYTPLASTRLHLRRRPRVIGWVGSWPWVAYDDVMRMAEN